MGTILIIDDNKLTYSLFRSALERDNFTIISAETGEEGIEIIKQNRELILVCIDLNLGNEGIQGTDICKFIKDNFPDLPFIIESGKKKQELYKLADEYGACAILSKPFISTEINRIVTRCLKDRDNPPQSLDNH